MTGGAGFIGANLGRELLRRAEVDEVVEVPVQKTTACTFGGDDLGTLYITTSWENLERGEDPLAGALFAVRPGVTGLPARPFAG